MLTDIQETKLHVELQVLCEDCTLKEIPADYHEKSTKGIIHLSISTIEGKLFVNYGRRRLYINCPNCGIGTSNFDCVTITEKEFREYVQEKEKRGN